MLRIWFKMPAAFFMPLKQEDALHMEGAPTTGTIRKHLETNSVHPVLIRQAVATSEEHCLFHWELEFPDVFERGGFDVVLGNPPWERIKLQEKEFFSARDPEIADAPNQAARERLIKTLPQRKPTLAEEFESAKHKSEAESKFLRASGRFPLTGKGDINTYSVFAETARYLLQPKGRLGMIVPTGIATDDTTKDFFANLVEQKALVSLLSFENEALVFPGIHHATKFCLLTLSGGGAESEASDFVFFARRSADLQEEWRHFTLVPEDFRLINPNTLTCPIFRTERDAEITKSIYKRVPILINDKAGANPWDIEFMRMVEDSHIFKDSPGSGLVPLYEAKMIHQFDHRFGTYEGQTEAQANQGKLPELTDEQHADPGYRVLPRYWIPETEVNKRLGGRWALSWLLGWRDVTSAVTTRSVIASILPRTAVYGKLPLIFIGNPTAAGVSALLANLNSFVLDYVARQKIGGTGLKYFHLKQLPILPPEIIEARRSWSPGFTLSKWMSPRVLELTYTSWDLKPFAEDIGYLGTPLLWEPERRFLLRCELDSAFFHLYGIDRDDVDYIMDTFPLVKEKDEKACGEYRTKRVILEIYDDMLRAMRTGQPYQTRLNPPPADPRVAHSLQGR